MSGMFLRITSFLSALIMSFLALFGDGLTGSYRVASPVTGGQFTQGEAKKADNADFYVSPSGNDDNDGSFSSPFATIDRAKQAVRETDKSGRSGITVALMAGEYRVKSLTFNAQDSGTEECPVTYCAYGDGETVINGGLTLDTGRFKKVTDEKVLGRLSKNARSKVLCCDLSEYGITAEDYGRIYAIGTYHTAYKYSGDTTGPLYCELFVNDTRQSLARYPDSGFLETEKVIKTGEGQESDGNLTMNPNWDTLVDPESDVYEVNQKLADRINSWETLDDVWMFGFWKYDWADASSPVGAFDYESRTISPKYVSLFGTKKGAPYYFFNVLEELDSEGEWYLDRENGIIYLYPGKNFENAVVDLSLSTDDVISGKGVNNLILDGFTVKGSRGDGIGLTGDGITLRNCVIKNIAGHAVRLTGSNNLAERCEICHTGRGGFYIDGGDRSTLTPGNSRADNNLIHDWSEIYQTYQPAVTLSGVGNICSHNEIYNSPHEAITYSGNNHIIEYNLIHDVCLLSDDAGAIYSGRHWDWYGTVVRYNCIYNLGSDGHKPNGIYFDDCLSGQTAYGNILVNIPQKAFHLGGGRDLIVKNNIIINTGETAFSYDSRGIEGLRGGWFVYSTSPDSGMWKTLSDSPWQSDAWQEAYPQMKSFSFDFGNPDDPGFLPNPANSEVTGNLIFDLRGSIGLIDENADKFSNISGNAVYKMYKMSRIFTNPAEGDYSLKENSGLFNQIPGFEALPLDSMGRY